MPGFVVSQLFHLYWEKVTLSKYVVDVKTIDNKVVWRVVMI